MFYRNHCGSSLLKRRTEKKKQKSEVMTDFGRSSENGPNGNLVRFFTMFTVDPIRWRNEPKKMQVYEISTDKNERHEKWRNWIVCQMLKNHFGSNSLKNLNLKKGKEK